MATDDGSLLAFEKHFHQATGRGADWARDLKLMYEIFLNVGFGMSEEEYEQQVELLGKEPEDYPAWVRKIGESWL